jgi:hypothetical protein
VRESGWYFVRIALDEIEGGGRKWSVARWDARAEHWWTTDYGVLGERSMTEVKTHPIRLPEDD